MSMTATLLIVSAVAAFSLGAVYNLTKDAIAAAKQAKKEKAIQEVVPAFDKLNTFNIKLEGDKDSLSIYQALKGGKIVGTAIETYTDKGFGGRIKIMAGFNPNGNIINTAILEHTETPGLGDKMDQKKSDFAKQFKGKNPDKFNMTVKKDGGDVDAITAATISSRAFCDALQRATNAFKLQNEEVNHE